MVVVITTELNGRSIVIDARNFTNACLFLQRSERN